MIPRLAPEDWPASLATQLRPRFDRLGYVGEFFRCAAHQPAALAAFMTFTEELKHALPEGLTEVVALTVSTLLDNRYERHQHERLCLKLGFAAEWIRGVERLEPSTAPRLTDAERAAQTLALAVVRRNGKGTAAELDALVQASDAATAVGVLLQIGRYVTHALMVNALELAPPVPSPLEAET